MTTMLTINREALMALIFEGTRLTDPTDKQDLMERIERTVNDLYEGLIRAEPRDIQRASRRKCRWPAGNGRLFAKE
jgi:hypothetical protein